MSEEPKLERSPVQGPPGAMIGKTPAGLIYPMAPKPKVTAPEHYLTHWGKEYERPDRIGYNSVEMLEFLKGHPWDQMALNYVHALRPSRIRVTHGEVTCDSWGWRVTVTIDENNIIRSITQEVEVGLEGGYEHGHDLSCKFKAREDAKA